MPLTLTAAQQQKLLELLQRELRAAAEAALAAGTTPAALARILDERRAALSRAAAGSVQPDGVCADGAGGKADDGGDDHQDGAGRDGLDDQPVGAVPDSVLRDARDGAQDGARLDARNGARDGGRIAEQG